MTPIRLSVVSAFALAITACSNTEDSGSSGSTYHAPPVVAAQGEAGPATQAAANTNYDTPAAYEESTGPKPSTEAISDPGLDAPRSTTGRPAAMKTPSAPKPAAAGRSAATAPTAGGTTHTVVKGDTLGGIAKKYGVSQESLKKANSMTKDTVVLGKQLVIPGH